MTVNTLRNDCQHQNPTIRGLALRTLSSMRIARLSTYFFDAIRSGLGDQSSYVRKTAVLAAAKLHRLAPDSVKESGFVSKLYEMIKDRDPQVSVNCMAALEEILAAEGGLAVNRAMLQHLFSRLKEYNEWAQVFVLSLVERVSLSEDETYDVMSKVDEKLSHANSAVTFAVMRLFLRFSEALPHLQHDVYERIRLPLLSALSSMSPEITFSALKHIDLLLSRQPGLFDAHYKLFYISHKDPSYVKRLKLSLFREVCNESNMHDLVSELGETAHDLDVDCARTAVRAMSEVCLKLPQVVDHTLEKLVNLVEMDVPGVAPAAVAVLQDVLRRFPEKGAVVVPQLCNFHQQLKVLSSSI